MNVSKCILINFLLYFQEFKIPSITFQSIINIRIKNFLACVTSSVFFFFWKTTNNKNQIYILKKNQLFFRISVMSIQMIKSRLGKKHVPIKTQNICNHKCTTKLRQRQQQQQQQMWLNRITTSEEI